MTDFEQLTQAIQQFINERDWKQFHKPKDCAISLTLEAAEVAELFQWKTDEQMATMKIGDKQDDLADELSDVLFWVLAMAYDFNIDLKSAFLRKLEKSAKKYPIEKVKGSNKKYTEY
ncbi:nucleotide pyrophosphohydrolase [Patescibacteria group bacterium]|nr:MAG: nucleotide pyrophosphohydrolase [Patescibacteria group bacterium]